MNKIKGSAKKNNFISTIRDLCFSVYVYSDFDRKLATVYSHSYRKTTNCYKSY